MSKEYFPVTSVHRGDLEARGFVASDVTDDVMEELAAEMGNACLTDFYWSDLECIAEELGIPKIQCPVCHENVDSCLICPTCGVDFSNPCAVCEKRGYHKEGCTMTMTK